MDFDSFNNGIQQFSENFLPAMLYEEAQELVTTRVAEGRGYSGPFYHGTEHLYRKNEILQNGFRIFIGPARSGDVAMGFAWDPQNPMPVHPLGYGVYLTRSMDYAKVYAYGNREKVIKCYLRVPQSEIFNVNFQAMTTWNKFWRENGFNPELVKSKQDRTTATVEMTRQLSSKFRAIEYTNKKMMGAGNGIGDKTQICVYNPADIVIVDEEADRRESYNMKRDPDTINVKDRVQFMKDGNWTTGVVTAIVPPTAWNPPPNTHDQILNRYREKVRIGELTPEEGESLEICLRNPEIRYEIREPGRALPRRLIGRFVKKVIPRGKIK
jgi:hypothetical protein